MDYTQVNQNESIQDLDEPAASTVHLIKPGGRGQQHVSSDDDIKHETPAGKVRSCLVSAIRIVLLIFLLYLFICSLTLLSNGFILIGGRMAGSAFKNNQLLQNPICGLMIGVVSTAFLQSSSTSTSIIITMVASGLFTVPMSIPMIMGANIGTSITGILVAVTQVGDLETYERAFSGATVHDMFNWLTVITLLPLEVATNYLYHVTSAIVDSTPLAGDGESTEFLSVLTDPLTKFIVQVNKEVLGMVAAGDPRADELPMLKYWCDYTYVNASTVNSTQAPPVGEAAAPIHYNHNANNSSNATVEDSLVFVGLEECSYIFHGTGLKEQLVGLIVLIIALVMLIGCLILMVSILKKLLLGSMARVIQRTINADFPGRAACLTGYAAIVVGAVITVLVQSSSVVSSALTPLVGLGVVSIDRVYPMMLGANLGTTSTAILASFAASGDKVKASFQIALCHLFFNLTGILIWFPVPFMRRIPISIAEFLGKTTARYRWFAGVYLLLMFFCLPLVIFGLSLAGWEALAAVGIPFVLLIIAIGVINLIQSRKPEWLPSWLQTWEFLPEPLRSLAPLDRLFEKWCRCCSCKKNNDSSLEEEDDPVTEMKPMNGTDKAKPGHIV